MLHLSNYQLRVALDNLKRDLEYHYGQYGVMGYQGFYNQFYAELYNWKLTRCNALETYVNAQFMVSRMEQQARYAANPYPRRNFKPKRKQIMPPKNKNYNNYNQVSKQQNNNISIQPNNNNKKTTTSTMANSVSKATNKKNSNVTRPSNVTLPGPDPGSSAPTPAIGNLQIKQEPFDGDEGFILNIKQEKPDNGYENVTKWVDDVNLVLNIKQEKVDNSYEVGQKRKCGATNNVNSKKAKCHS